MVRQMCRGSWRTTAALVALTLIAPAIGGRAAAQTLSVSGSPATLRVRNATAGGTPAAATDASTTYSVSTPAAGANSSRKITAHLNANMPPGVTLTVEMAAPSGSASPGPVALSTSPMDVVTGMSKKTDGLGLGVTYRLAATLQAGVVSTQTRTVTFTIVTPP
jgi:hypothetical protein